MHPLVSQELQADHFSIDLTLLREGLAKRRWQQRFKRAIDVATSITLVLLLAPLLVLIAAAVRLESPGPAIFRQRRVGYKRQEFTVLKFRTMFASTATANDFQTEELSRAGILFKKSNDPRVTPLGKWLRRWSIDEWPQLLNVLKGDMSLVGPRPLTPFMLEPYPELAEARSLMRPGITGLWQVRARENNLSALDMAEHDLEYIRDFSLALDSQILIATRGAVISGKGAV